MDKIHALRASLMIPPVFLIAAIGAEKLHAWLAIKMPAPLRTVATACVILAICGEPLQTYFRDWANSAPVARDFEAWLVDEAVAIRDAPVQPAKYVAIPRPIFRLPEVPQVIDFLAATSTPSDLLRSNVHYVFPDPGQVWRSVDFCRLVHSQHPAEQTFCVSRAAPLRP